MGIFLFFGTVFDPNYIGIPLVAASALLLDDILRNKKKIVFAAAYFIILFAVVFTASRGNTVGLIATNFLTLWTFFKSKEMPIMKRMLYLLLVVSFLWITVTWFKENYSQAWIRMTDISSSTDNGRFELWESSILAWKNSPILGTGIGGIRSSLGHVSHNTYIQLLSETGVLGGGLFVMALISIMNQLRLIKEKRIYFIMLIGVLLQILFLNALQNRCFWGILSWIVLIINASDYE